MASFEEIVENDFNLNIPRYVDTFEEEEPINLTELSNSMRATNKAIEQAETELYGLMKELTANNDDTAQQLADLMSLLQVGE
ncbi:Type I restriction-modification system methylation subunit [Brochothrix campestris FSL F6-1037]|uniref:Type I restriction-modification system methylation subunit n=1 Tax=Brochothrix campestris FSL F6-1037 TaxID=1265861 RepID=W7CYP6_9LIST|nr:Type I restriction-modification system methylation subunit [Brochothrix campestris FSL F6-1037]